MLLTRSNFGCFEKTTSRGYERIEFELSIGSKGKKCFFKLWTPTVTPGARMDRRNHDRSIVLDAGAIVIKFRDAIAPKVDPLAMNRKKLANIYDVY
jgi:hypothetical protein